MEYKIDENMRISVIYMLHTLAMQDGVLHRNEMYFIQGILDEYQYDLSIIDEMPKDFEIDQVILPEEYAERMEMLYNLLYLMKLDAQVSKAEIKFVRNLTLKFSIEPELVEELSNIMKEYENELIPKKLILSTIKKYMN